MKVKISGIKIQNRKRGASSDKVQELAKSISSIGLLNPITLSKEHVLIAGLHRLEAHKLLGLKQIEASIIDTDAVTHELAEVDENLIRNELSVLEQSEMLLRRDELLSALGNRALSGDNRHKKSRGERAFTPTTKSIGAEIGLSERVSQQRKQIAKKITPQVREMLRDTRYANSPHGLLQLAREPEPIQKIAVKKMLSSEASRAIKIDVNEPNIFKMAIQQAHRERNISITRKKEKEFKLPDSVTLHHGDFRTICKAMSPNSIDMVLVDALYEKQAVELYRDIGEVAYRLLKPSGFCILYVGTMYLPEIFNHLSSTGLKYHWAGVVKYAKGRSVEWNRRAWSRIRLFLIYYKEPTPKKMKFFEDYFESPTKQKDFHEYQQNQEHFEYLISRFTHPGDTVLDVCCGSGTTLLAALKQKRKAIGIDVDKKAIKATKIRLSEIT